MNQEKQVNDFKGFSLFNDIDDQPLRIRNQAVVLTNIACDHSKNGKITVNGANLILNYFKLVKAEDKSILITMFHKFMGERGFHLVKA